MRSLLASQPDPLESGRRFLIACGTERYDNLPEEAELSSVPDDVQRMVRLFTGLGYDRVLSDLGENPTSAALGIGLSEWLLDHARKETDIVVFYYSGHGRRKLSTHYLLTADSKENNLLNTALPAQNIAKMLADSVVRHLLVILDTCYAGAGVNDLAAVAGELAYERVASGVTGSGLWFLAAARPKDEAEESVFAETFVRAVEATRSGQRQKYVQPQEIVSAINRDFLERRRRQRAQFSVIEGSDLAPFIPNPRHRPGLEDLPNGVVLELQQRLRQQDLLDHFGPRSRGLEFESESGWYFTGRAQVLRELVIWLSAPASDRKARVVTGRPGSGKSAVLARLVTLSDRSYRSRVPGDSTDGTWPPPGIVDVAIHARRKRLEDLVGTIAAAAGLEAQRPEELLDALARRRAKFVIVVDAVDEAGAGPAASSGEEPEPRRIARRLLKPLATLPGVWLLVGARPELLNTLGPAKVVLDLDQPDYVGHADLAGYVEKVLLAEDDPEVLTPYRENRVLANRVAEEVAKKAYPTFLVARLVARNLVAADEPVDISAPGWDERLPTQIGEAFREYLERFGEDEPRVRRLLIALAYAEGAGLPWDNLWAPLAGAISGHPCADEDIEWLLRQAGAYVVESLEDGRSVFRLYHQALADYLRNPKREGEIQRRLTRTLIQQTPPEDIAPASHKDWLAAHPYVRTHLAIHAGAAGILGELVADPTFLVAADPPRLLNALSSVTGEVRRAYQHAFKLIVGKPPEERLAYLQLAARCTGADKLATQLRDVHLAQPWSVPWARWRTAEAQRLLGRHAAAIRGLTIGNLEGRPVVISGDNDGDMRVWDLADGTLIHASPFGQAGGIRAVAVGELHGRPVIISGGGDHKIRIWDLADGTPIHMPRLGHDGAVTALTTITLRGRPIIVSGSEDHTMRVWDLTEGTPIYPPLRNRGGGIRAVAAADLEGDFVVVFGGADQTVSLWNPGADASVAAPLGRHDDIVTAVATGEARDGAVAVSGSADGTVRTWSLADGRPYGAPRIGHAGAVSAVAVSQLEGRSVVVSGSVDRTVQVWDLLDGIPVGGPRVGHDRAVTAVAVGSLRGREVVVSGGEDRVVRVWDLADPLASVVRQAHTGRVTTVTLGRLHGRAVVASGSEDGAVRLWDFIDGEPIGEPLIGAAGSVQTVAWGEVDGYPALVSGGDDCCVQLWNLGDGRPSAVRLGGHAGRVRAVAIGRLNGHSVVASAGDDGTVRLWDPVEHVPLGNPLRGNTGTVFSVMIARLHGRPAIISGSAGGAVAMNWYEADGTLVTAVLSGHVGAVRAVAMGQLNGRPILVSGGADRTVRLWDLTAGNPVGTPVGAHDDEVTSIVFGQIAGYPVIVSGGTDRTVRVWGMLDGTVRAIDVGSSVLAVALGPESSIVVGAAMGPLVINPASTH